MNTADIHENKPESEHFRPVCWPPLRFGIGTLMNLIVALALALAVVKAGMRIIEQATSYRNEHHLSPGQAVKLIEDSDASVLSGNGPMSMSDFYSGPLNYEKAGGTITVVHLKIGTLAVVTMDSGDDDATGGREVAIKIVGGQHNGSVVIVLRRSIRDR